MIAATPPPVPAARFAALAPRGRQFPFSFSSNSDTIATSWPYRWRRDGPASALPRDGIMIDVLVYRRSSSRPGYPRLRLPVRLPRTTTHTLEGAATTPEYRVLGRTGSFAFEIRVDIRNARPPARLLDQAQRAVDTLLLPP
jgi:hypothetical protein